MAKQRFDLKSPIVRRLVDYLRARASTAHDLAGTLESAVFPIVCHTDGFNRYPEQTGSCVAFRAEDQVFLLSAAHVFEPFEQYPVIVSGSKQAYILNGDRFSTVRGPSGTHQDDPIDAAVFHVHGNIPDELRCNALTIADLDLEKPGEAAMEFYVAAGFYASRSKRRGKQLSSTRELLPTTEYAADGYPGLGVERQTHLALNHDNEVIINGVWAKPPSPKGLSGGAIFRMPGLSVIPGPTPPPGTISPKLSAITIESHPNRNGPNPVIIGARIGFHLGLIHRNFPDLLRFDQPAEGNEPPLSTDGAQREISARSLAG